MVHTPLHRAHPSQAPLLHEHQDDETANYSFLDGDHANRVPWQVKGFQCNRMILIDGGKKEKKKEMQ